MRNIKKFFIALIAFGFLFLIIVSFSGTGSSDSPEELCRKFVLNNIDQVIGQLETSKKSKVRANINQHQQLYRKARKSYKEIEFFIEYYSFFDAKYYINGPLVLKNEIEYGPTIFEPAGFQVIEENLFADEKTDSTILNKQYNLLIDKFSELKKYYSTVIIEKPNLAEALRLEVIRVMCLTLNGYDCTINKENTIEAAHALNGVGKALGFLKTNSPGAIPVYFKTANEALVKCVNNLRSCTNSDNFNRLKFIVRYCNPFYNKLCGCIESMNPGSSLVNYAVDFKKHGVFDLNTLNKQHFSLYRDDTLNIKQEAELGRLLFFDPVLSGNNKRACASCHKPELAFTDGMPKSLGFDGVTPISRNAPTLLNASYQKLFFHDGRILNLEEQAGKVFANTFEMNSSGDEIVKKLKQSPEYVMHFRTIFKGRMDTSITFYAVIKCIAEYIKTLDSKNSRLDKYIRGDSAQLGKSEIRGFNLFTGKALCGSCHFYPLFNGTVPPFYNDNEFEILGTPENAANKNLDSDPGREAITHSPIHKFAFKTPGIRNIALTAPYMHNGVYKTLDEVLTFYNKGGGIGFNYKVENQTLPFDSLGLSKTELNDIKNFLLALTDTSHTTKKPSKLPRFNNAILDKRKIGGDY